MMIRNRVLAVLACLTLVACEGWKGGGSDDARPTRGGEAVYGHCDFKTDAYCFEANNVDEYSIKHPCQDAGGGYGQGACPADGAVGFCSATNKNNVQIKFTIRAPYNVDNARKLCEGQIRGVFTPL